MYEDYNKNLADHKFRLECQIRFKTIILSIFSREGKKALKVNEYCCLWIILKYLLLQRQIIRVIHFIQESVFS